MPTTNTILLFLAAALPLCLTPGPGMLYVLSRAAAQGRAAGVVSALSLSVGTLIHVAALALGLSALLARVPLAYDVLRLGGAAYLIYLGVRMLLSSSSGGADAAAPPPVPLRRIFLQGVLTGTLNPKVALFLLAFLPQFIDPSRGTPALQIVVLGLLFEILGGSVNLAVGASAGLAANLLRAGSRSERWLQRISAAVFIGLGLRLALPDRR
jgi:threonine/homoserine/homoserine lactone efflux protein